MRFIVDRMLGRLATWLRLLGFDAAYFSGPYSRKINQISLTESRIVLTRNNRVSAKRSYRLLRIKEDDITGQLTQVVNNLGLSIKKKSLFSRCTYCNCPVEPAEKKLVFGKVPSFIYKNSTTFSSCPVCKRIYWQGSHNKLLLEQLKKMLQIDVVDVS